MKYLRQDVFIDSKSIFQELNVYTTYRNVVKKLIYIRILSNMKILLSVMLSNQSILDEKVEV